MTRVVFLSIVVIGVTLVASNGTSSGSGLAPVVVGVKGGLNYSGFTSELGDNFDYRPGAAIGLFEQARLSTRSSLLIEIAYSQKGGSDNSRERTVFYPGGLASSSKFDQSLNYLTVPVLLVVSFPFYERYAWSVSGGLYVAYLVSAPATHEYIDDTGAVVERISQTNKSAFKSFDGGAVLGTGFLMNLSRIDLTFEARWEIGFVNVTDSSNLGALGGKNSSFSILAGVGFPLDLADSKQEDQ